MPEAVWSQTPSPPSMAATSGRDLTTRCAIGRARTARSDAVGFSVRGLPSNNRSQRGSLPKARIRARISPTALDYVPPELSTPAAGLPVRLPPTIKEPGSGADVGTRPRLPPLSFERSDVLAANQLGRALYADLYADPTRPPNFARFTFLDAAARRFFPDWDLAADMSVANLRTAAGQNPHDRDLHDLVGELSTRSEDFRRRWGSHDVRTHGAGVKHYHHPNLERISDFWGRDPYVKDMYIPWSLVNVPPDKRREVANKMSRDGFYALLPSVEQVRALASASLTAMANPYRLFIDQQLRHHSLDPASFWPAALECNTKFGAPWIQMVDDQVLAVV